MSSPFPSPIPSRPAGPREKCTHKGAGTGRDAESEHGGELEWGMEGREGEEGGDGELDSVRASSFDEHPILPEGTHSA